MTERPARRPIVVAGMHRSGTSLFASLLSSAGVDMGDELLSADANNQRGYFEDTSFLKLNRQMLDQATPQEEGHRDWGWTLEEALDRSRFEGSKDAARSLIATRQSKPRVWGWKDPRTTVTLDFWHEVLVESACDPLYVFLYRFPWDVADSMQRIGADVFLSNPEYAAPIWTFYNRQMLSFYERHRENCLLVSSNALWRNPQRMRPLLADKFGGEIQVSFDNLKEDALWRERAGDDPLISLFAAASPQCLELLSELDRRADLPATGIWTPPGKPSPRHRSTDGKIPDLSIVIPCYNHGEFLIEAVASAERSAPVSSELIIVNDGSTQPRTQAILEVLRDAGYTVIDQPNGGLSAARNRGITAARSSYLLPLDSDNRLCSGFAQTAIQVLDGNSSVGVVYGDRQDFGKRRGRIHVPPLNLQEILLVNYIDACAVYRKAVWTDCSGYDEQATAWEDWEFWISAAERGWHFERLDAVTFEYCVRPQSLLSTTIAEEASDRLYARIVQKHRASFMKWLPGIMSGFIRVWLSSPLAARHMQRLAEEFESDWKELGEDRTRWMERATVAEQSMIERDAHLQETENERGRLTQQCAEIENQREQWEARFWKASNLLEARQKELDDVHASATWRWTQSILSARPVRRLLGTLVQLISARSQRQSAKRNAGVKQ